jgi:hypothetical protein
MKIVAIAIAGLIASTLFMDTAWAVSKKNSRKVVKTSSTSSQVKKNMVSVKPHARSAANKTKKDNWSTIGNVNPYTGKKGTKRP